MASEATAAPAKKTRRKRAVNKSEEIRAVFKQKPEAGPTEVRAILKRKGVQVSVALVSNVKAAMLKKQGGTAKSNGAAKRRGRPARKAAGDTVSMAKLLEARKFAAQVGGVDQAVDLLKTLAQLQ
jgi:hypothetical protein